VAISGDHAYVADGGAGLQVIDIHNPADPRIVGHQDTPLDARRVAVSQDVAYVADGGSGLQVIDISDPERLRLVGGVEPEGYAYDVAVDDAYAYVTNYGLTILHVQCGPQSGILAEPARSAATLLRIGPNPNSWETCLRLQIRVRALVDATVYDIAGRRQRQLCRAVFDPGVHDLTWDQRDDTGRKLAAGAYLVRVSTSAGTTSGRCVIVR